MKVTPVLNGILQNLRSPHAISEHILWPFQGL